MVNKNRTIEVKTATIGIILISVKAAVAISCMRRCPAVKFAVNRTPNAKGRMNKLIVSIIIKMGTSKVGVPSGRRCAKAVVGFFIKPIKIVINQSGIANAMFNESCVVGVKVYGRSPNRFIVIKNIINAVRIIAHLCPLERIGCISWYVKRLINHICKVIRRLSSHRLDDFKIIIHGIIIAKTISGIPISEGLRNWSKKVKFMVNFKALV